MKSRDPVMPLNNIDSSYPSEKGEGLVWLIGGRQKNPFRPEAFICDRVVTMGTVSASGSFGPPSVSWNVVCYVLKWGRTQHSDRTSQQKIRTGVAGVS